jgi:hypothetical protein
LVDNIFSDKVFSKYAHANSTFDSNFEKDSQSISWL